MMASSIGLSRTEVQAYLSTATELFNEADRLQTSTQEEWLWIGKGYLLLLRNELDDAEQQFDAVLRKNDDSFLALMGKAKVLYCKENHLGALQLFLKALQLQPDHTGSIRLAIAYCCYNLKLPEAKAWFERVLEVNPSSVPAQAALIVYQLNELREKSHTATPFTAPVLKKIKNAYSLSQHSETVNTLLADYLFSKQDYHKFQSLVTSELKIETTPPFKAYLHFCLAKLFHVHSKHKDALLNYQNSVALDKRENYALFALGQMLIVTEDFDAAIECFEGLLAKEKVGAYECYKIIGFIYMNKPSMHARALWSIKNAHACKPEDIEVTLAYASLLQQSAPADSLQLYMTTHKKIVEMQLFDVPVQVYNNIGVLNLLLRNYGDAETFLNTAMSMAVSQENSMHYVVTLKFNLACLYEETNPPFADKLLAEIIKQNSKYVDAYLKLGYIAKKAENHREADDYFKDAIGMNEKNALAWLFSADLAIAKQALEPYRKILQRIIDKIDKKNLYALVLLGELYCKNAANEINSHARKALYLKSIQCFQKVLSIDNKCFYAANGLGVILALKEHYVEAAKIFTVLVQSDPAKVDTYINIGHAHLAAGNFAAAVAAYQKFASKSEGAECMQERRIYSFFLCFAKALYLQGVAGSDGQCIRRALGILRQTAYDKVRRVQHLYNEYLCEKALISILIEDEAQASEGALEAALDKVDELAEGLGALVGEQDLSPVLVFSRASALRDLEMLKEMKSQIHALLATLSAKKGEEERARRVLLEQRLQEERLVEEKAELEKKRRESEMQRIEEERMLMLEKSRRLTTELLQTSDETPESEKVKRKSSKPAKESKRKKKEQYAVVNESATLIQEEEEEEAAAAATAASSSINTGKEAQSSDVDIETLF